MEKPTVLATAMFRSVAVNTRFVHGYEVVQQTRPVWGLTTQESASKLSYDCVFGEL